jgi:hypothetical protein
VNNQTQGTQLVAGSLAPAVLSLGCEVPAAWLVGIVHQLTHDQVLQKDLMQEALLHLWQMQPRRPGEKLSWYQQNCKDFLRNLLRNLAESGSGLKNQTADAPILSFEDLTRMSVN